MFKEGREYFWMEESIVKMLVHKKCFKGHIKYKKAHILKEGIPGKK
jgi:hypothetical protein